MNLEPPVIESIRKHRRSVMARKVQFFLPFLLGGVCFVVLTVGVLSSGTHTSGESKAYVMLMIFAVVVTFIVIAFSIGDSRKEFREYVGKRVDFSKPGNSSNTLITDELSKYRKALQGVCIGTGEPPPKLVVVRDDSVNAFAFIERGGPRHIVITEGMLDAPLSIHEINAVMAHELAHLIIGNNVREPGFSDVDYYPGYFYGAGIAFSFLGLAALFVILTLKYTGSGSSVRVPLLVAGSCLLFIAFLVLEIFASSGTSSRLAATGLTLLHIGDDLLADSIAVKITMNPDALESAIKTVREINEESRTKGHRMYQSQPEAPDFMTKYLFVGPPGSLTSYHQEICGDTTADESLIIPRKKREPFEVRIKNLEFIKKDRWPAFEK